MIAFCTQNWPLRIYKICKITIELLRSTGMPSVQTFGFCSATRQTNKILKNNILITLKNLKCMLTDATWRRIKDNVSELYFNYLVRFIAVKLLLNYKHYWRIASQPSRIKGYTFKKSSNVNISKLYYYCPSSSILTLSESSTQHMGRTNCSVGKQPSSRVVAIHGLLSTPGPI